jgi:hypothetical protein
MAMPLDVAMPASPFWATIQKNTKAPQKKTQLLAVGGISESVLGVPAGDRGALPSHMGRGGGGDASSCLTTEEQYPCEGVREAQDT